MIFRSNNPRTIDDYIIDGIIEDAILHGGSLNLWDVGFPKGAHRLRFLTYLRRLMKGFLRCYPDSFTLKGTVLSFDPFFLSFCKTHSDMGSTSEEARIAWAAMKDLE